MGIIKAAAGAIGGGLADQWLEVIEADRLSPSTVMAAGIMVRKKDKRLGNRKGTENTVSNGSIIHVYPNQFMMLVDGGKVVDYTAEPGYYKVDQSSLPSLFNGAFGASLKETFERVRYAGVTPYAQKVIFINLQEIRDIPFGTTNAVNYFDAFYNAELYFRAHGYFSIKIVNPLLFYAEVVDKNADRMESSTFKELYLAEFLGEFQAALNRMSVDGIRASHVASKATELTGYMREIMDEDWRRMRGMEVQSVGIKSVSFDEESKKLIQIRNEGAMLGDPSIREGYVQGAAARGIEAAGSNANGAMQGFMGIGVGMQGAGLAEMSRHNQQQIEEKQSVSDTTWQCSCGQHNTGKFCSACGKAASDVRWRCACGKENEGNFCSDCGSKRPERLFCPKCGKQAVSGAKFCPDCGEALE
ncbi:MAG: zinc-ribbon domain-containing protein [Clostridiales bacterium]|nr:zinc-ribbon domain-containing protein [Clostridiales bacterium]